MEDRQLSVLDQELADYINEQISSNETDLNYYRPIWERAYKNWLRWRKAPVGAEKNKSRLFLPMIFSMIETILPILALTIFSVREFLDVKPTETSDVDSARRIKKLINWQIDHVPDKFIKLIRWVKSCIMYGTGILKVYWEDNTKEVASITGRSVANKIVKPIYGKNKKLGHCGPNFRVIDLVNFRKDTSALTINECTWAADKFPMSKYDIKRALNPETQEALYINTDILFRSNVESTKDEKSDSKTIKRDSGDSGVAQVYNKYNPSYEIIDYWGLVPKYFITEDEKDKDDMINANIVMAGGFCPILKRANEEELYNGESLYIQIIDTIDPHDFYGEGKIHPSEPLQHEKNNNRNQMLEALKRCLNPRKYVAREGSVDEYQLKNAGIGGIIKMNNPTSDVQSEINNFDMQKAILRENLIDEDFYRTTKVYPSTGMGSPGQQKATIYMAFEQALAKGFAFNAMTIEEMGISQIGAKFLMLNARHQRGNVILRITGEKSPLTIPFDDLQKGYDFRCIGSASEPMTSYENRRQMVADAMAIFGTHSDAVNLTPLIKEYFEASGFKNYEEMLKNPSVEFLNRIQRTIIKKINEGVPPQVILKDLISLESPNQGINTGQVPSGENLE